MHTPHSQPAFLAGAARPAAPQLKPPAAGAGAGAAAGAAAGAGAPAALGRGSSQAGHWALSAALVSMQTPQVQLSAGLAAGGLTPAIAQLKPDAGVPLVDAGAAAAGVGVADFG
jgi:hypothetical protein